MYAPRAERTLLSKHQKPFTAFAFWYIQVLRLNPSEQCDTLCQYPITLEIIGCNGSGRDRTSNLGSEGAVGRCNASSHRVDDHLQVVQSVHDQLLHALHRVVELGIRRVSPDLALAHSY